jgi:hypothetical protein
MSDQFLHYTKQLTLCMLQYQYIEFALRGCIVRYHATAKFRLDGYLPYEVPLEAIDGAALGLLVKWFKLFSTNIALVKELNKLKVERDRLAHQGFVFTYEEQNNDAILSEKTKELEGAHRRAEECFARVHAELEQAEQVVQRAYSDIRAKREAEGLTPPEPFKVPTSLATSQNGF